jgi:hypothetical protein
VLDNIRKKYIICPNSSDTVFIPVQHVALKTALKRLLDLALLNTVPFLFNPDKNRSLDLGQKSKSQERCI